MILAIGLPVTALGPMLVWAHGTDGPAERLAMIGPATDFTLTAEDGTPFSTAELRGKVVALNFVFTRCTDVCPIATAKMVQMQRALGDTFGREVFFVSVSVDLDKLALERFWPLKSQRVRSLSANEIPCKFFA